MNTNEKKKIGWTSNPICALLKKKLKEKFGDEAKALWGGWFNKGNTLWGNWFNKGNTLGWGGFFNKGNTLAAEENEIPDPKEVILQCQQAGMIQAHFILHL